MVSRDVSKFARHDTINFSQDWPLRLAGVRVGLPEPNAAEKSVSIVSPLDPTRQLIQFLRAAAAENDVIGNKRFLQQPDGTKDFAFPLLFAELFQSRLAEVILDDVIVTVRQIAELKLEHAAFPDQGRSQSGAQSKKQHPPAAITAERLHRGIIDDADWFA